MAVWMRTLWMPTDQQNMYQAGSWFVNALSVVVSTGLFLGAALLGM